jgi:hypothetical protein
MIVRSALGFPLEIISKASAWIIGHKGKAYRTKHHICYRHGDKSITIPRGWRFDGATFAPNLRRSDGCISDAFPVHDKGWETGTWDDGSPITFARNNRNMVMILLAEGFPCWVVSLYEQGVSLHRMRAKWIETHGHA